MERNNEVIRAKLAQEVGRYDDMVDSIKKACMIDGHLSDDERNLLSVGYKGLVGSRRNSWRFICNVEHELEYNGDRKYLPVTNDYRQKLEREIEDICHDCCDLINLYLLPMATDAEALVFYSKMKGDYYWFLAETKIGEERQNIANLCKQAYEEASATASTELESIHPTRLSLALHYSKFYIEIDKNYGRACQLAKEAFDQAMGVQCALSEDSTTILELLVELLRDYYRDWAALPGKAMEIMFQKLSIPEVMLRKTKVCHFWRKNALEDPSLWQTVDMSLDEYFDEIWETEISIEKGLRNLTRIAINMGKVHVEDLTLYKCLDMDLLNYISERALNLKKLCLKACASDNFGELLRYGLAKLNRLEELELVSCTMPVVNIMSIIETEAPQLKSLKLSSIRRGGGYTYEEGFEISLGLPKEDVQLTNLEIVDVRTNNDELVLMLARCPQLEVLKMCDCLNKLEEDTIRAICLRLNTLIIS